MACIQDSIRIEARPVAVWELLADVGGVATWNPLLSGSQLTSTQKAGVGATRHCDVKSSGRKVEFLKERVIAWTEGKSVTMEIYESSQPIARATIKFDVFPEGAGCIVKFEMDYALKFGIIGKLMDAMMARREMADSAKTILEGLKAKSEAVTKRA